MKILIAGAAGMLGTDLMVRLSAEHTVVGAGLGESKRLSELKLRYIPLDLMDAPLVAETFTREKPDVVFHCAAMTQVDLCETEQAKAYSANGQMTRIVAEACRTAGAFMIYFSTDYVFDGKKTEPILETDTPCPVSVYGHSKLKGEQEVVETGLSHAIFRISWLYGIYGNSFPRTILEKARTQNHFDIVSDQIGGPTYTWDIAGAFTEILNNSDSLKKMDGQIFNLANRSEVSWAGFAEFLLKEAGFHEVTVKKISSLEFKRPARRPANSVFSLQKLKNVLGIELRPWQEAAKEFVRVFEAQAGKVRSS